MVPIVVLFGPLRIRVIGVRIFVTSYIGVSTFHKGLVVYFNRVLFFAHGSVPLEVCVKCQVSGYVPIFNPPRGWSRILRYARPASTISFIDCPKRSPRIKLQCEMQRDCRQQIFKPVTESGGPAGKAMLAEKARSSGEPRVTELSTPVACVPSPSDGVDVADLFRC